MSRKIKATNKFKEITASETILETYSIKNEEELVSIQNDIEAKEKKLQTSRQWKVGGNVTNRRTCKINF